MGGMLAIVFGLAGLILPVIPGWLLIIVGVLILGEKTRISKFILSKAPKQVKEILLKKKIKNELLQQGDIMNTIIVICAFNEPYIADVIKNLEYKWPIIIVDDGSKETPVPNFREKNVHVVRLKKNRGKGYAMRFGFKKALEKYPSAKNVVFVDADLINFKPGHVEAMLKALELADMVVGRFGPNKFQDIANFLIPFLSGQRAAKTIFWKRFFGRNTIIDFGIETSINAYAKTNGCTVKNIILDGVSQHLKENKYGISYGIKKRFKMYRQIVWALIYTNIRFRLKTRK
ncbi:hypothetical protein AUK11_04485 [bacterium CG2_30_37_16]|nr:MAG: hypothetical protein AUK11_04485 [bacterium CG2_30_37_16]